jgi:hypothetical protein
MPRTGSGLNLSSASTRTSRALRQLRNWRQGDGQVIVIPFNTTPIEVSVGFRCQDGSIIICDTNNGGRYVTFTAEAEARDLGFSDARWHGNTRALARIMKRWQRERNVPLKSFHLERLAVEFLQIWPYSHHDVFWYDWMVRDFLGHLIGSGQRIPGDARQRGNRAARW